MAMTANISSSFCLYCAIDAADVYTIVNPGRAFRIIGVDVFNQGGTGTVTITDGTNTIVNADASVNGQWHTLVLENTVHKNIVKAGGAFENVVVTCNASGGSWAAGSEIIIWCLAVDGGQSLTVTT